MGVLRRGEIHLPKMMCKFCSFRDLKTREDLQHDSRTEHGRGNKAALLTFSLLFLPQSSFFFLFTAAAVHRKLQSSNKEPRQALRVPPASITLSYSGVGKDAEEVRDSLWS